MDLDESRQPISINPFIEILKVNFTLCELQIGLTDNKKIGHYLIFLFIFISSTDDQAAQLERQLARNRKFQDIKYNFRGDSPPPPQPELQVPQLSAPEVRPLRSASLLKYMPIIGECMFIKYFFLYNFYFPFANFLFFDFV